VAKLCKPYRRFALFMKAIPGAATLSERIATVTGMRAGMPDPVFVATMQGVIGMPWRIGDRVGLQAATCRCWTRPVFLR
jgi:hypothetical protein